MTVCRFFQQGYCRYGDNCRFEHSNPYKYSNYGNQQQQQTASSTNTNPGNVTTEQLLNQVAVDTNAAINGNQWLLSSYGPFKAKPNFPGLSDISPEEIRFQTYEAKSNGTFMQLENQIRQYQMEAMEKFKALIKPSPIIIETIEAVYKNLSPKDPFVTNSVGFNQNVFGNAPTTNQTAFNVFGGGIQAQTNVTPNNIFAQAANSLFSNQQQPVESFGNQGGFFGGNTFTSQMGSGVNSNIFGNANQQNTFGMQNQSQSPFGVVQPQQNTFSVFNNNQNQTNNVFGQPTSPVATAAVSPSSIFASANVALTQNTAPTNVFEKPATIDPNSNPFGVNINPFSQNQSTNNVFGNSNNVFENKETIDESAYSKMEDLKEDEIEAFKSNSFKRGMIPESAPPLELCN